MKTSIASILKTVGVAILLILLMASCERHEHYQQGPRGYDGDVYFGVSYSSFMPYSYADNNPSIPQNPNLGQYYHSYSGSYEFEYFINPYEYWHGTYDLWINAGGPGSEFGDPGPNGIDNYLMLICNPQGFYEERSLGKSMTNNEFIELDIPGKPIKITMQKANVHQRPARLEAKFSQKNVEKDFTQHPTIRP